MSGITQGTPRVVVTPGSDGSILLDHPIPLPDVAGTMPRRLCYWADRTPNSPFLTEEGRTISFGEAADRCTALSERLTGLSIDPRHPLMIIGENGIDHALVMLAATMVGAPVAVVSPAYAGTAAAPWLKLDGVLSAIDPGLIVADDPAQVASVLKTHGRRIRVEPLRALAWLYALPPTTVTTVIDSDTVAKLLLTSGSTGTPKAVINTQRMMVSNMFALEIVWPFLRERPPVLVDWLPWNHTFGGNCCFNIALWFGGHLIIDKGRPAPGLIERSAAALRRYKPTLYFNVPVGYELLLPLLEEDPAFAATFLGGLDFAFNAGAALPAALRARLETVGEMATGHRPNIVGGWGSTETAPFSTTLSFPTDQAANLGVPIPGTTIKMVPSSDRYELRVRGPNVTPGYWREPALTAAAFDADGFYRIGDAGRFVDPQNPSAGILFDGRIAENFKLSSGTFVNVGGLRLAAISTCEKLISDAVVVGEGRNDIGLILFANDAACRALLGDSESATFGGRAAAEHPAVIERLATLLRAHNVKAGGSSMRITRFIIADHPPDPGRDEITDKGYLNQRRVIENRAALIERLFDEGHTV